MLFVHHERSWMIPIGGVMVAVLVSSTVDCMFPDTIASNQTLIRLACVASPLSMQHQGATEKTYCLWF